MGCARVCGWLCLVVVLAIAAPFVRIWANLQEGQPFALITSHNASDFPAALHSRLRVQEYGSDKNYFQWWNFLVYDAETRDHWTIVYSLVDPPSGSSLPQEASVALMHLRGGEHVAAAGNTIPLSRLRASNSFDLQYLETAAEGGEGEGEVHNSLRVLDDGAYEIVGNMPGQGVSWQLTVERVHGYYGSEDGEAANKDGFCAIQSTLFGYHSSVRGTITTAGTTYTITSDGARHRAYAAGSWGCNMPGGQPEDDPADYPWSWFWLVMPAGSADADGAAAAKAVQAGLTAPEHNWGPSTASSRAEEVGMVWGTARYGFGDPVGSIWGGYSVVGISERALPRPCRDCQWTTRTAKVFHNSSMQVTLQASSSHGFMRHYDVQRSRWATFRDAVGTARLPLRQRFESNSSTWEAVVDFHSELDQYFRIPAVMEDDAGRHVFSDFRAVGVLTHVYVRRLRAGGRWEVLVNEWTDAMTALEYAYKAPADAGALQQWMQQLMPHTAVRPIAASGGGSDGGEL